MADLTKTYLAPTESNHVKQNSVIRQLLENATSGGSGGATPTALVGLTAIPGSATTFIRSDGAPALDLTISPTWTGVHTFSTSSPSTAPIHVTSPNGTVLIYPGLTDNNTYIQTNASAGLIFQAPGAANIPTVTVDANSSVFNGSVAVGGRLIVDGAAQFMDAPWADITHPSYGAVSGSNSTSALNAAISSLVSTYGSGVVFVPPGNFLINSTITIPDNISLVGCGANSSLISSNGADITMFSFTGSWNRVLGLAIVGSQSNSCTNTMIGIGQTSGGIIRDCRLLGGKFALSVQCTDWTFDNNVINGQAASGGNLVSNGANWYIRNKFDITGVNPISYAYLQGTFAASSSAVCENHFVQCDFSGGNGVGPTYAIYMDDGGNNQLTTAFSQCVFGGSSQIVHHRWTTFDSCEMGPLTNSATNPVLVNSCTADSPMVVSGNKTMGTNINIT